MREAAKFPIQSMIGKLWWLAHISRPDIYTAVHKVACWQNKPSKQLLKHITHIEYLNYTPEYGIVYQKAPLSDYQVRAFCDSNFATENEYKSRLGYFFFLGNSLISWKSQISTRVMTSSTEAECHALYHTGKENVWLREFFRAF